MMLLLSSVVVVVVVVVRIIAHFEDFGSLVEALLQGPYLVGVVVIFTFSIIDATAAAAAAGGGGGIRQRHAG